MIGTAKNKSFFPPALSALWTILFLVVALFLPETRVWGFTATPQPASGVYASVTPTSIGENYDGCPYDASDSLLAAKTPRQIGGELSKQISKEQRKLIHDFFGGGVEGAEAALQNLSKGGNLPQGLTRETLETYSKIAQNAIDGGVDKIGTQAARLKAIQEALKRTE